VRAWLHGCARACMRLRVHSARTAPRDQHAAASPAAQAAGGGGRAPMEGTYFPA